MRFTKFFFFFLFVCTISNAQTPLLQWQKSYGGTNDDIPYAIKQTVDGGYIVAGSTASQDGDVTGNHYNSQYPEDFWIVKTDACGNLQWQKDFGGTSRDIAYSVQQTTDKGYIVAGFTSSSDGDVTTYHGGASDFWVLKLDTNGAIKWQKTLGGAGEDGAQAIQQTTDGGYVVVGWSTSNGDTVGDHDFDYWVVKLDTGGNIKWQKLYGGSYDDTPFDIKQTSDGGYIAVGYSESNDGDVTGHHGTNTNVDYWIIKIDSVGSLKWEKSYGGTKTDQANSVIQSADGGYVIAGFTSSANGDVIGNHGAFDYWVIKTDTSGLIQWKYCFGGSLNDQAYSITKLADGSYAIAGITYSNDYNVSGSHGGTDYWITNVNLNGVMQWQKTFGGSGADAASAIEQTNDGGLIVSGASNSTNGDITNFKGSSDYWVVKINTVAGNIHVCNGDSTTLIANGADSYTWSPAGIISSSITITPTANTVYTLTTVTGTCTTNNNLINITVNPLPIVTFSTLGFPDTVCSIYGSQNLTGGMPGGGIYSGTGVSGTSFNPSVAGIGNYLLTYNYTDANQCSNYDTHYVTVELCSTTGIGSYASNDMVIYPNPFKDNIQITAPISIKKVTIYDVIGNKIKEASLSNYANTLQLDMHGLIQGVYFVEIYYLDNTYAVKKMTKY